MLKFALALAAVTYFVYPFVLESVALFNHVGAVLATVAG